MILNEGNEKWSLDSHDLDAILAYAEDAGIAAEEVRALVTRAKLHGEPDVIRRAWHMCLSFLGADFDALWDIGLDALDRKIDARLLSF